MVYAIAILALCVAGIGIVVFCINRDLRSLQEGIDYRIEPLCKDLAVLDKQTKVAQGNVQRLWEYYLGQIRNLRTIFGDLRSIKGRLSATEESVNILIKERKVPHNEESKKTPKPSMPQHARKSRKYRKSA